MTRYQLYRIIMGGLAVSLAVCCQKKFDEPPPYAGADIRANTSIIQLRGKHLMNDFEKITDDMVIEGVVIANDSSDNFYKTIILQDSTGGITLKLDATGLYSMYPVGSGLFVKLKGLWMGDYARMLQLGAGVDRSDPLYPELISVPQPLFDRYLVKSSIRQTIQPLAVSIDRLNDSLQSCLVAIDNVEMPPSDTGRPFADAVNRLSVNHTLRSCNGANIYLRTSGFAGFANIKTPRGNGRVTAVYTVFRNEKQLLIRDTSDIRMDGLRCTGSGSKLLFYEDFEQTTVNTDLVLPGWKNISETGGKVFQSRSAANNRYAEISAFASAATTVVSWLVSPPISLANSANEQLSFSSRDGFDNGATIQAYISTSYDGISVPSKAKWTLLKARFSEGTTNGFGTAWVSSGNISLNNFTGNIYLAFRYEGADPVNMNDKRTTSFQIDNIRVEGN